MELLIKSINGTQNLEVNENCTVIDLKLLIQFLNGMYPEEQKLHIGDVLLDDDKKLLTSYGISSKCEIAVHFIFSQFNLKIHVQGNRIFELSVKISDDLMSVKKKLQTLIPMHIDEQLLLYKGTELTGNRLLYEYNISDSCLLNLITKLRDKVDFIINCLNQPKFSLAISSNSKISDIKDMLQSKLGILPAEQRLIMNCRILENYETVSECFTNEKIVINLLHQKRTGFLIFVQFSYNGSSFSLEVGKTEKIIDIKRKIENVRGYKVNQQKIIFREKTLNNDETIDNCALEWNSIIHVVIIDR